MPSAQDRFFGWPEMSGGENEYDAPDYSRVRRNSAEAGYFISAGAKSRVPSFREFRKRGKGRAAS
jgi:hypothetical protein